MKKAEMKVIRFDAADVIATSGCSSLGDGWTSKSYKATGNLGLQNNIGLETLRKDSSGYYNYINGVGYDDCWADDDVLVVGSYYHYDTNTLVDGSSSGPGNVRSFWLCTNESHRNQ